MKRSLATDRGLAEYRANLRADECVPGIVFHPERKPAHEAARLAALDVYSSSAVETFDDLCDVQCRAIWAATTAAQRFRVASPA
jgi:hypothetical protein